MKKAIKLLTAMLLIAAMCVTMLPTMAAQASAAPRELYVSLTGDDRSDGTINAPFKTLEKARNTIHEIKNTDGLPAGGIRVYLRAGTYVLEKSFSLTKEDSGTAEAPISYRAYPGEKVVISGGYNLDASQFKNVTDKTVLDLLPKSAQKNVYVFDLASIGVTKFNPVLSYGWGYPEIPKDMQIYYNGKVIQIARYPNDTDLTIGNVKDKGKLNDVAKGSYDMEFYTTGGGSFYYDDPEIDRLDGHEKDLLAFGYWSNGWSTNTVLISDIDASKKLIELNGPTCWGITSGQNYYFLNSLRLLDAPGEYYIDRDNAKLYLYPQGDIKAASIQLSKAEFDLFSLNNASHITVADLDFTLTLQSGISIKNGKNNLVKNCNIYKIAGNGVNIKCDADNTDNKHGVIDSEFYDIGYTAVYIVAGNRKLLQPGNCFAYNNIFHNFGQVRPTYEGAVNMDGGGNAARYNKVYDAPHLAFNLNGNDLAVEYNDVSKVSQVSNDTGAVYSYGQNSYLGFQINNNYFHDITTTAHIGAGVMAVYMDDAVGGATINGNIMNNINNTGIFLKGKNVTAKYNILKDISRSLYLSDYNVGDVNRITALRETNEKSGFLSELWFQKYPYWKEMSEIQGGDIPTGNIITDNVLINSQTAIENTYAANNEIDNKVIDLAEAGFVDAANGNYELKDDSAIYSKIAGFPKTQFAKMGLYTERFNAINKNQVSLFVNTPVAFVGGEETRVDKTNSAVMPVIQESRTLVPVRFIAEGFGATIDWNGDTATAKIALSGKTIELTLNSNVMKVDGADVTLDVPAQSYEGRTLIPLRALVESLGKKVLWDTRGMISIGDSETPFGDDADLLEALYYSFQ